MKNYYTAQEVAKILEVTKRHVTRLCKDGAIKGAVLMGKIYVIPKASVEKFLKEKKKAHSSGDE